MMLSKIQLIIVGVVGFVIVFFGLVFSCVIPFRKGCEKQGPVVQGEIHLWAIGDSSSAYEKAMQSFRSKYPEVQVMPRIFRTQEEYEFALTEALIAGKGPDIFIIPNNGVLQSQSRVFPLPQGWISPFQLRQWFPQTVELDFAPQGIVYALPTSLDTLALIYNRDLLNEAGIVVLPETWEEFKEIIPRLTTIDRTRKIVKGGAALGGSKKSVDRVTDIISLLMLQTGTAMVNKDLKSASFGSEEGLNALKFYTQFSNPASDVYTWSDSFSGTLDAFSQEKVAIMFDYSSAVPLIKERNPFVNLGLASVPQPKEATRKISYAHYWGYTVSLQSRNPQLAWEFILNLTTVPENVEQYAMTTKKLPSLLSLINQRTNDPDLAVFARQSLIARSWPQVDPRAIEDIFSRMVSLVINNQASPRNALDQAQNEVNELMGRKTF